MGGLSNGLHVLKHIARPAVCSDPKCKKPIERGMKVVVKNRSGDSRRYGVKYWCREHFVDAHGDPIYDESAPVDEDLG